MDAKLTKRLVQAVQELSLARNIDRVMEIVRTVARELTGADGATFVLRDKDMCYYADEDAISPLWKGSRFPMRTCISGWAMLNKKGVVIEDIYEDNRIPHDAYRPTFVKSLAMVPIRTMDPIGAIGNYWAEKYLPTEEQLILLQSLADITAVTIENVNLYNDLEERVRERTFQLKATHLKLEEAYKELESFSYSVSHDLRAPLRSIAGYSEVIKEENYEALNDDSKKALGSIQKSANQMNLLIDTLLRFSKLTQQALDKGNVDTGNLVDSLIKSLSPTANSAEFIVHPLPVVMADTNLITQVWSNLISNAIKYSSKVEHPVIEVGSQTTHNGIIFFVKDNGAGFDMKYADKLFGVFQRLHHERDYEGTGVGLSLVKRIVNRHGGRVWAESEVNKGATFYFSLPV
jgi:signal transduction histidine kinase